LGAVGRSPEEIDVSDDVLRRLGDHPALREQVANALVNKGAGLGQLGRSAEAIDVYDDVARHFGDDPPMREQVAKALRSLHDE